MQTAVRMFALLIAVAGLAAASFTPGNSSAPSQHPIVTVNGPGPLDLPAPLPCESDGSCMVQTATNR
jgi:hypothetical protein